MQTETSYNQRCRKCFKSHAFLDNGLFKRHADSYTGEGKNMRNQVSRNAINGNFVKRP